MQNIAQTINKTLAIFKLATFIGLITGFGILVYEINEMGEDAPITWTTLLIVPIVSILPLYYLFKSALWDQKNMPYQRDLVLGMGMIMFILILIGMVFWSDHIGVVKQGYGGMVFIGLWILIGVRDLVRVLRVK